MSELVQSFRLELIFGFHWPSWKHQDDIAATLGLSCPLQTFPPYRLRHSYCTVAAERERDKDHSRGLSFPDEDARQRQLERGLHHFDRQRLELQRQVGLGRRWTGEPLQVDVCRGQHLTMALVLLQVDDKNNHDTSGFSAG